MKKLSMLAIGLLSTVSVMAQSTLPTTSIKDVNSGKKIAFNETIKPDRVTVVSFWATWCVPCKKEINNIRKKMPTWKAETDFDFITVSIDESRMEGMVRSYVKSQGWEFPAYLDANSDLKRSLNFQNVPFTLIVGKDGKVAWMHTGYEEGGENELYDMVKQIAAK